MGGPWEKYQSAKPWEKYQSAQPQAEPDKDLLSQAVDAGASGLGAIGKTLDSYLGSPVRAAVGKMQSGGGLSDAIDTYKKQFGEDPSQAPTGKDIAAKTGLSTEASSPRLAAADDDFSGPMSDRMQMMKLGANASPAGVAGAGIDVATDPSSYAGALGGIAGAGLKSEMVSNALSKAGDLGRAGVAQGAHLATLGRVPSEAFERLIQRPSQVLGAADGDSALNIANKARDEFLATDAAQDSAISKARESAASQYGGVPVETKGIQDKIQGFLDKYSPAEGIEGALTSQERDNLTNLKGALEKNNVSSRDFGDLQKYVDMIDNKVKNFDQSKIPGTGDTRYQSFLRGLRGAAKQPLHDISPELTAADSQFSNYATDAGRLGRLENPDTMESFINNFYGKNKSIMQSSAENVIPGSIEDIKDLGASRAFDNVGPAGSHAGLGNMGTMLLGEQALQHHSPLLGVAAAMTQPQVMKQVVGRGAQAYDYMKTAPWAQEIAKNPQLLSQIQNPSLRNTFLKAISDGQQFDKVAGPTDRGDTAQYSPPSEPQSLPQAQKRFIDGN